VNDNVFSVPIVAVADCDIKVSRGIVPVAFLRLSARQILTTGFVKMRIAFSHFDFSEP
jgi:hypothetical protein